MNVAESVSHRILTEVVPLLEQWLRAGRTLVRISTSIHGDSLMFRFDWTKPTTAKKDQV